MCSLKTEVFPKRSFATCRIGITRVITAESWIYSHLRNFAPEFNIKGYKMFYTDKVGADSGRILLYSREIYTLLNVLN